MTEHRFHAKTQRSPQRRKDPKPRRRKAAKTQGAKNMCGICGIVGQPDEQLIKTKLARIAHRRPSIIDFSPAGHEPMSDAGGRIWLTFNGEIYNFKELRRELEASGHRFESNTF